VVDGLNLFPQSLNFGIVKQNEKVSIDITMLPVSDESFSLVRVAHPEWIKVENKAGGFRVSAGNRSHVGEAKKQGNLTISILNILERMHFRGLREHPGYN